MKLKFQSFIDSSGNGENLSALLFLTLGSKYFNLVHNVLEESIKSGNSHLIISDSDLSWDEYFQKTKWSDFYIMEPILFSFYHGLELTIKGLLLLTNQNIEPIHTISELYIRLKETKEVPGDIQIIIEKYVTTGGNSFVAHFLNENGKTIDQLYESLRYPTDKKFQNLTNYISLHYQEESALKEFRTILEDIKKLQTSATSFYRILNTA